MGVRIAGQVMVQNGHFMVQVTVPYILAQLPRPARILPPHLRVVAQHESGAPPAPGLRFDQGQREIQVPA